MFGPHGAGSVAACGGKVYVWAGTTNGPDGSNREGEVEVFDPAVNRWVRAPNTPAARNGAGVFVLGGRIYSVGGEASPSGRFTPTVTRFDPATNEWTRLNDFPVTAWDPLTIVCEGKAYVMGGRRGYGGTCGEMWVYDEAKDCWTARAAMPRSVLTAGVAAIGTKIYVIGGIHFASESDRRAASLVQVYDVAADRWTSQPMPCNVWGVRAVEWGGDVWLFARTNAETPTGGSPCRYAYRFSSAGGTWVRYPFENPAGAEQGSPLAQVDGRVYFADFYDGQERLPRVMRVDLRRAGPGEPVPATAP